MKQHHPSWRALKLESNQTVEQTFPGSPSKKLQLLLHQYVITSLNYIYKKTMGNHTYFRQNNATILGYVHTSHPPSPDCPDWNWVSKPSVQLFAKQWDSHPPRPHWALVFTLEHQQKKCIKNIRLNRVKSENLELRFFEVVNGMWWDHWKLLPIKRLIGFLISSFDQLQYNNLQTWQATVLKPQAIATLCSPCNVGKMAIFCWLPYHHKHRPAEVKRIMYWFF